MSVTRIARQVGLGVLWVGLVAVVAWAQMDPRGALIKMLPEVDLGQVAVGTTKTLEYVFTNPHGERVTINTVGFDDLVTFHMQDPPWPAKAVFEVMGHIVPTTLPPGGQFRFTIRFTPPAAQVYRPGNYLTLCVTTAVTRQHIHYHIPLVGRGVVGFGEIPPGEEIPPTTYGPFTGTTNATGWFEIRIPTLPTTTVTGHLTECPLKSLPNQQVLVTLVPKPGVREITRIDQIGAVRISSPGYGEVTITHLLLASSMDEYGRVYATVSVGTVCLRPTAPPVTQPPVTVTPTAPISVKTGPDGKFTASPLPGITITGTLTACGQIPLPNQDFTLTLVPKAEVQGEVVSSPQDLAGFTFSVPGYKSTTATQFSKLSMFGLTWYDVGTVCLFSDRPPCKQTELRVLTQNGQLIPEVWIRTPPVVGPKKTVYGGTPHRDARCREFARLAGAGGKWTELDIVCLQEVFSHAGENHDFKDAIAGAWLGQPNLNFAQVPWFTLDRTRVENVGAGADARRVTIMRCEPPGTDIQQIVLLKKGDRWVVAGPDSTAAIRYTIDGGLMILSKHPVIAASGFTFKDQAGIKKGEEMSNKGALYARIQLDPENPECYIHVFDTHLAARDPEFNGPIGGRVPHPDNNWAVRQKQIAELVTFISNCIRDDEVGRPIILCGDFNVIAPFPANWGGDLVVPKGVDATKAIPSPQYDELMKPKRLADHKLTDAWKEKRGGEPGFTWLGNDWKTQPDSPWGDKGNPLAPWPGWPQRIDYIFYNAGAETSPLTLRLDEIDRTKKPAKPFQWGNTQSYVLSDHLGVIAKFTVSPK